MGTSKRREPRYEFGWTEPRATEIDIEDVFMAIQPRDHRAQQILDAARRAAQGDPNYARRMQDRMLRNAAVSKVLNGDRERQRKRDDEAIHRYEREQRLQIRVGVTVLVGVFIVAVITAVSLLSETPEPTETPVITETENPYE